MKRRLYRDSYKYSMLQKRDDKKPEYQPFKIRAAMLDLDEYLRIFILPQIPVEYKDYRADLREAMAGAWRAMLMAAATVKRERQKHLVTMKMELAMVEVYLKEVRDVCYRGKEKRRLDNNSARRFDVCAKKQKEVMTILWMWVKNENGRMDASKSQKTVGLIEKEEL